MRAYLEVLPDDRGGSVFRAWSFELAHWGVAGVAGTEGEALQSLRRATGSDVELAEIIDGADEAFARDLEPATPGERAVTLTIMERARRRSLAVVHSSSQDQLTRPTEWLPEVDAQGWQSAEELAWSFAETESRSYPAALGLPQRAALETLAEELQASKEHALELVRTLPDILIRVTDGGGVWSSTKLLRMLAWRERSLVPLLEFLIVRD